jgi:hypothetical protein
MCDPALLTVSFEKQIGMTSARLWIAVSIAYPAPIYRSDTGTRSALAELVLRNNHDDTVG